MAQGGAAIGAGGGMNPSPFSNFNICNVLTPPPHLPLHWPPTFRLLAPPLSWRQAPIQMLPYQLATLLRFWISSQKYIMKYKILTLLNISHRTNAVRSCVGLHTHHHDQEIPPNAHHDIYYISLYIMKAQGDGCKKPSRQKNITQTPAPTIIIGLYAHTIWSRQKVITQTHAPTIIGLRTYD